MKKKWIALILAAAMTAAALPGCSSPAGGSSAPAGDSSGAAKQTVVKVAGYSQYNPYTYLDANGDPAGYDVEVLAAVAEKLPQYKFEWDMIDWDAELVGVQSGKYALCSANIWKTAEREKIYLFEKNPINYSSVSLVVRKDDASINTLDDLVGKKVAPLASSNALISVISDYNKAHPDKQIQVENVNGFGNADGMKAVASDRYDAQVLPDNTFEKGTVPGEPESEENGCGGLSALLLSVQHQADQAARRHRQGAGRIDGGRHALQAFSEMVQQGCLSRRENRGIE